MDLITLADFWEQLDRLVADHRVVVDRPKGSRHPRHEDMIYPLNYGYLEGTTTIDQGGIDVWIGGMSGAKVISGLILTIDLIKKDAEIKIALNCGNEDLQTILLFHKENNMGTILLRKPRMDNNL
jgi:inorganic pyrophosphatase